jgi:hypothetical protein
VLRYLWNKKKRESKENLVPNADARHSFHFVFVFLISRLPRICLLLPSKGGSILRLYPAHPGWWYFRFPIQFRHLPFLIIMHECVCAVSWERGKP